MHPVLLRLPIPGLGEVPIYSYGVMLGLSLVVGWFLTLGLAQRDGLPREPMANCYVVTAVAAVVGSRVLYVLTNLDEFESFGSIFALRTGGLVAYGGFLGGLIGSWVYLRRLRLPLLPWADVAVPSLASGLLITRIGCYLFGCDFGKPLSESAPAFLVKLGTFPRWPEGTIPDGSGSPAWVHHVRELGLSPVSEASLPVHPTQLYESVLGAVLLVVLLAVRKRQAFRGQVFLVFAFAYGAARFALEIVRDDAERGDIPPALSLHWLLAGSLALFAASFALGMAPLIRQATLRVGAQVASFLPSVAIFALLRPAAYAQPIVAKLSTSQAVGLLSGVAAAIAYGVLGRAARAHPAAAMKLEVPPELLAEEEKGEVVEPRKAKTATKTASKARAEPEESEGDADPPRAKRAPDQTEEEDEEHADDSSVDGDADDDDGDSDADADDSDDGADSDGDTDDDDDDDDARDTDGDADDGADDDEKR